MAKSNKVEASVSGDVLTATERTKITMESAEAEFASCVRDREFFVKRGRRLARKAITRELDRLVNDALAAKLAKLG